MLYCHTIGGIVRCVSRLDECIKDFAKVSVPAYKIYMHMSVVLYIRVLLFIVYVILFVVAKWCNAM